MSDNSLKFAIFSAEVNNTRSMVYVDCLRVTFCTLFLIATVEIYCKVYS